MALRDSEKHSVSVYYKITNFEILTVTHHQNGKNGAHQLHQITYCRSL